jgi:hypothetical protein
MSARLLLGAITSGALALTFSTGCDTEAFCFADCGEGASDGTGVSSGGNDSTGAFNTGGSVGAFTTANGTGGGGTCMQSNGGLEICDAVDNDCNGVTDDIPGIDYNAVTTCGTCDTNCLNKLEFHDPATVTCTPSSMPGQTPGVCDGECLPDFYDFDMNPDTCETYCLQTSPSDTLCNNKDDDCDGTVDDDVDTCSTTDCGSCGVICVVANGSPACVKLDADPTCNPNNMQCQIGGCDPGWVDLDGLYSTGCEYQCTPTGPELCDDQIDNDCDGLLGALDDLSGDPAIGVTCTGDPDGICALPAHEGTTACVNGQVVCEGPDVLFEGDEIEVCNNLDDDCDAQVDDNPSDEGAACGASNIFPCTFGTQQCINGALSCVGAINPGTETCNGVDDNCDGGIDLTNGQPPPDAVGACNVPIAPPAGATSPCQAGTKACTGGVVTCQGSVGPSAPQDQCGDDSNCDGTLNNQPNFQTDATHCGNCTTNCLTGAVNAQWGCSGGTCQFIGCLPGWVDLNGDQDCEYQCTFTSAQEACNNQDDDCDGQVDENVTAPTPSQVCGVSPLATRPECTTQVGVQCVSGAWQCTFPGGVCSPSCAAATETCDGLDNDCDGFLNENVPDFGQPCASDDGLTPGHGACRTIGTKVCNAQGTATVCSAVKANCALLPGGCTETCDDTDNDCDGLIDETFNNKGSVSAHFYKPKVIQIGASLWTHQYEASRPNATSTVPGSGNGYWTSAPAGETLDKQTACSETGKIPWFNVTPTEAQQTCVAMGGTLCSNTNWKTACMNTALNGNAQSCTWGYATTEAHCTSVANLPPVFDPPYSAANKFCNLGAFDFITAATPAGNQDGLLPTASSRLKDCYANWEGLQNNPVGVGGRLFDITGNLREITQLNANTFILMGGAFNSNAESGATCDFDFYAVDNTHKLFDTGFRCCFTSNPTQ